MLAVHGQQPPIGRVTAVTYLVTWDADAVIDFERLTGRDLRKQAFSVVEKLRALGPRLVTPHMKPLKGEPGLLELRPSQGKTHVRGERVRDSVRLHRARQGGLGSSSEKRACEKSALRCLTYDNVQVIMRRTHRRGLTMGKNKSHGTLIAEEVNRDPDFRKEWEETAFARYVAVQLIGYRADNGLSQRALGDQCGFKQPFIATLESGERNPKIETLFAISRATGIEWALDIRQAEKKPKLISSQFAAKHETFERDGVAVTVAAVA
jgi:DNA-binding XRE family transcriptional regulator